MIDPFSTSLPKMDLQPGKPPVLRVSFTGDASRWAAEHRNALRALVAEHGALLVRGLGLIDAARANVRRSMPLRPASRPFSTAGSTIPAGNPLQR
jgi:hypothetical protein